MDTKNIKLDKVKNFFFLFALIFFINQKIVEIIMIAVDK